MMTTTIDAGRVKKLKSLREYMVHLWVVHCIDCFSLIAMVRDLVVMWIHCEYRSTYMSLTTCDLLRSLEKTLKIGKTVSIIWILGYVKSWVFGCFIAFDTNYVCTIARAISSVVCFLTSIHWWGSVAQIDQRMPSCFKAKATKSWTNDWVTMLSIGIQC